MGEAAATLQSDSVLESFVDDCAAIWRSWLQDGLPGSAASRKQRRERRFRATVGRLTTFMVRPSVEFATSGGWGAFNWTRWKLRINQCYTGQDAIRYNDFVELCSTVYHETRHAEQFYRIAQGLAAGNLRLPDARAVEVTQQLPAWGAIKSCVVTSRTDAIDDDPRYPTATQRAHLIADRMRIPLAVAQHADRQRDGFARYLESATPVWFRRLPLDEVNDWLRATYGQRAGTFLSNAGVLQVFGVNDHESARLVPDLLGQETAVFKTMGQALDSEKSGISYGEHHSGRPLLTPDEVRNMPQQAELLFLAGQRPIVAGKLAYYADSEFRGLYDAP